MLTFPSPMDPVLGTRSFAGPVFARRSSSKAAQVAEPSALGGTFDTMMELPAWMGDFIRFLGHGSMAFVGIYMGADKTGFVSTVGWAVGIMSAFASLLDVCSIIGRMFGEDK